MATVRFHPCYPNVPLLSGVYGGGVALTCNVSKLPIVTKDTYWSNREKDVDILDICMPPGDVRFHDKYPKVPLLHYMVRDSGTTCDVTGKVVQVGTVMWGNRTHNIDVSEEAMGPGDVLSVVPGSMPSVVPGSMPMPYVGPGSMPSVVPGSGYGVIDPTGPENMPRPFTNTYDIGTFGLHQEKPGISFLTSAEVPDQKTVLQLIEEIGGSPEATFDSYPEVCVLGQKERTLLIDKLDQQCGNEQDYKWSVTPSCLKELIGKENFQKIADRFPGNDYNEIKLRRCCAEGQCINFHTDFSECTMQIPLNSDTEYVGGQLVFATSEGLQYPSRPAGGITIHRNDIVHGVTRMEQGVRYGLFFLKNKEKK